MNVLAGAEDDHFLLASGDEEVALGVEVAEVAGAQPSVFDDFSGSVGPVPITLHDNGPAQPDLSDGLPVGTGLHFHLRVRDLHVEARNRAADRADKASPRRAYGAGAAAFGKSVGLDDVESEGLKVAADLRVETRAAGDEITDLRAQRLMRLGEEELAQVDARIARRARELHQHAERDAFHPAALLHLLEYLFVNEIEELRHAAEEGRVALAQGEQQLAGVELLKVDDPAPHSEGNQQVGHLRQRVKERQHAKYGIGVSDVDDLQDGIGL